MTQPVQTAAARPARPAVLDLIGNTPLVEVTQFDTGCCQLFLKLESQNPGGSIKDRIGLAMIETAEREGRLKPGGTVIEATAGNTGLGLALVARAKGYRVVLVVPDKMSSEKVLHLKALGAEVHTTRSDVAKGHPEYYQDMAARLAKEAGGDAFYIDQFNNPANPLAHEMTTAPEIWQQMGHRVDAIVCGVGSGGTLTGLKRYFQRVSPETEFVLADPKGSVLAPLVSTGKMTEAGSWLVEGIGEDFVPPNCDLSLVREAFIVSDAESFETARALLSKEAILAGSSTGTLLAAALKYCRAQRSPKRVVTFVCDSGNKYLSKMFNDYWMLDQGLLARDRQGNLRDLITRRHADRATVTVAPTDILLIAYQRMKLYEISQLPVLDGAKVVGIIDESDLLLAVYGRPEHFRDPVSSAMNDRLEVIEVDRPLADLLPIFEKNHVALVVEGGEFLGLITRIDLLNHLRRSMA